MAAFPFSDLDDDDAIVAEKLSITFCECRPQQRTGAGRIDGSQYPLQFRDFCPLTPSQ
jgi:hypothetical protein